jgi:hypothetical protein
MLSLLIVPSIAGELGSWVPHYQTVGGLVASSMMLNHYLSARVGIEWMRMVRDMD